MPLSLSAETPTSAQQHDPRLSGKHETFSAEHTSFQSSTMPALADTRTFDFIETAELPFVAKSQRVVEEVRVRKQQLERNSWVEASLRHTEVRLEETGPAISMDTEDL